ncbi:MAG: PilN domain-containing protein, partial [Myxococcota bacterium]
KRLWLTKFEESEGSVRLEGVAKDGGDVYELAQRLKASRFFTDVRLLPGRQRDGTKDGDPEFVNFALQVKVTY